MHGSPTFNVWLATLACTTTRTRRTFAGPDVRETGDYEAVRKTANEHAPGLPVKRAVRTPNHYSLTIEGLARR